MLSENVLKGLRSLIEHLQEHPVGSAARSVLTVSMPDGLDELALNEINRERREASAPLVFSLDLPGFVVVGREGAPRAVPEPQQMSGLRAAHQVFLLGPSAPSVLRTDDPNGLRNALSRAADWVETVAHCAPLAVAIRAIKVRKDGVPEFRPARPTSFVLGDVFSACSEPHDPD